MLNYFVIFVLQSQTLHELTIAVVQVTESKRYTITTKTKNRQKVTKQDNKPKQRMWRFSVSSFSSSAPMSLGFINIHLKRTFVSKLLSNLLINGVQPPPLASRKKVYHSAWNQTQILLLTLISESGISCWNVERELKSQLLICECVVPMLRWWWISPLPTLPKRCTWVTCVPPSSATACVGCLSSWATTFSGQIRC